MLSRGFGFLIPLALSLRHTHVQSVLAPTPPKRLLRPLHLAPFLHPPPASPHFFSYSSSQESTTNYKISPTLLPWHINPTRSGFLSTQAFGISLEDSCAITILLLLFSSSFSSVDCCFLAGQQQQQQQREGKRKRRRISQ